MKLFTTILFSACFLLPTYVFSQEMPTATIVSDSVAYCETGQAILKIKLTGKKPFALSYKIGGSSYIDDNPFYGDTITKTFKIDDTSLITITKVYDDNYPYDPFNPSDPNKGSTLVFGSMEVRIDKMPIVKAGLLDEICGYEYNMKGEVTGATTDVWWSDPGQNASFTDSTLLSAVFAATDVGQYKLTLNAQNGKCHTSDEVDITLKGRPKGEITNVTDWSFCTTDEAEDNLPIALEFTGKGNFTYALQDEGGNSLGSYTSDGAADTLISVSTNKTISLFSLKDGQGCTAEAEDMQGSRNAVDAKPTVSAGEDTTYCGDTYILNAKASPGTIGKWTSETAGITFADGTIYNTESTATFSASETFKIAKLRWTETTTDALACASFDTVEIKFIQLPALTLISLSNDQICADKSTTLNFEPNGNAPWTIDYNLGGATLNKSLSIADKKLTVLGSDLSIGNNDINITKIKDSFNCESALNLGQNILVDEKPIANAGSDIEVCGTEVELDATPFFVEQGEWILSAGEFTDVKVPNTSFTANNTGVLNLVWKEINGVCADTDTVQVTFFDAPGPIHEVTDTFVVYAANKFELTALPLTVGTGQWSIMEPSITGASFSDASLHNALFTNLTTKQIYKLEWKAILESAPEECREKIYTVFIDSRPMLAPTGISPDGDEINDKLIILGAKENSSLTIFNKHGKLVFKMDNYDNSWGGTDQSGTKLVPDTYLYVYQDEEVTIKNYLIIKY